MNENPNKMNVTNRIHSNIDRISILMCIEFYLSWRVAIENEFTKLDLTKSDAAGNFMCVREYVCVSVFKFA